MCVEIYLREIERKGTMQKMQVEIIYYSMITYLKKPRIEESKEPLINAFRESFLSSARFLAAACMVTFPTTTRQRSPGGGAQPPKAEEECFYTG